MTIHDKRRFLGLIAAAALSAASFSTAARAAPTTPALDIAAADNAFGFRLLDVMQKTAQNGNVVLSPVSAALDLAMLLDGAAGETRQQIQSALSLEPWAPADVEAANARLVKVIRTPTQNVTLSVADSLWVDKGHVTLRPGYIERARTWYDAEIAELDFSDPDAATQINAWASKETDGKIPKVIDALGKDQRLLLLDATYFKGEWAHKFDKALTQAKDFTLVGDVVKQVPRMAGSGRFDYFETPQLQAVRLPFGKGDLVMEILLPAPSSSLGTLQAQLLKQWQDWQTQYASRRGTLELPRFELKSDHRLNEPLQALGVRRAFRRDAQLTGIFTATPDRPPNDTTFVSSARQSTYWKVDEEGAEAAAVTSIAVHSFATAYQERPFSMIVDRPFFCAIEDRRSGVLLFIGTIYDPT